MANKKQKKSYRLLNIVSLILLCFFCAFTFCGCMGMGGLSSGSGGSSGGGSSGGSSGGGSSGSGTGGGSESGSSDPSINDYNDVFMGVIGIYEVDANQQVFYDKYKNSKVSFKTLRDRQFDALATYLYNSLYKIYGSTSASNIISGYGSDKTFEFENIINTNSQKIIAGLKGGTLANSNQLNYANAINGGYDLDITTTDNGDGTVTINSISYNTATTLSNVWVSQSAFTKENLKKALGYIYQNTESVSSVNSVLGFSDNSLKSIYTGKRLTDTVISGFSLDSIKTLGFSKEYMWNVLYFLAYSVIGETNVNHSINNQSVVFSGENINQINSSNYASVESAFEKYKGYNIILPELVQKAFNLSVALNGSSITYSEYFNKSNWQTTLYPRLSCQEIIYFDKVEDVADSKEKESEDFSEDVKVTAGTVRKLRELIYIPKINYNSYTGSNFKINGILFGLQSENLNVNVEMTFSAIYDNGDTDSRIVVIDNSYENVTNGKVKVTTSFDLNTDILDCSFYEGDIPADSRYTNIKLNGKETTASINDIESAFKSENHTVSSTGETLQLGVLNVYNNIIDIDYVSQKSTLDVEKNVLSVAFNYYNGTILLNEAQPIYLMYFELFD